MMATQISHLSCCILDELVSFSNFQRDNVLDEIIFGWPRQRGGLHLKELLSSSLQSSEGYDIGWPYWNLFGQRPPISSGGYKRRLAALAIQLASRTFLKHAVILQSNCSLLKVTMCKLQSPDLLILDEPLAGLDWKAQADVVTLLRALKEVLTLLVVSHDLKELASIVDHSWKMEMGGILRSEELTV